MRMPSSQADVAAGAADQPLGVDEVAGIEKKLYRAGMVHKSSLFLFRCPSILYHKRRAAREYRTEKAQDRAGREARQ